MVFSQFPNMAVIVSFSLELSAVDRINSNAIIGSFDSFKGTGYNVTRILVELVLCAVRFVRGWRGTKLQYKGGKFLKKLWCGFGTGYYKMWL